MRADTVRYMARRWQAMATVTVPVADPGSEPGMAGPERYAPLVSVHVRVAWPPGADLAAVEQAVVEASTQALVDVHARVARGGR